MSRDAHFEVSLGDEPVAREQLLNQDQRTSLGTATGVDTFPDDRRTSAADDIDTIETLMVAASVPTVVRLDGAQQPVEGVTVSKAQSQSSRSDGDDADMNKAGDEAVTGVEGAEGHVTEHGGSEGDAMQVARAAVRQAILAEEEGSDNERPHKAVQTAEGQPRPSGESLAANQEAATRRTEATITNLPVSSPLTALSASPKVEVQDEAVFVETPAHTPISVHPPPRTPIVWPPTPVTRLDDGAPDSGPDSRVPHSACMADLRLHYHLRYEDIQPDGPALPYVEMPLHYVYECRECGTELFIGPFQLKPGRNHFVCTETGCDQGVIIVYKPQ